MQHEIIVSNYLLLTEKRPNWLNEEEKSPMTKGRPATHSAVSAGAKDADDSRPLEAFP